MRLFKSIAVICIGLLAITATHPKAEAQALGQLLNYSNAFTGGTASHPDTIHGAGIMYLSTVNTGLIGGSKILLHLEYSNDSSTSAAVVTVEASGSGRTFNSKGWDWLKGSDTFTISGLTTATKVKSWPLTKDFRFYRIKVNNTTGRGAVIAWWEYK